MPALLGSPRPQHIEELAAIATLTTDADTATNDAGDLVAVAEPAATCWTSYTTVFGATYPSDAPSTTNASPITVTATRRVAVPTWLLLAEPTSQCHLAERRHESNICIVNRYEHEHAAYGLGQ